MKTVLTAAATAAACAIVRHQVEKPGFGERRWGRVCLRPMWNQRGAFGLPVAGRALAVPSLLALGLVWCCRHNAPVSAGLVLGGGGSNLIERLRPGNGMRLSAGAEGPRSPGTVCLQSGGFGNFYRRAGTGAFQPPGRITKLRSPWDFGVFACKGTGQLFRRSRRMSPVVADPTVMARA